MSNLNILSLLLSPFKYFCLGCFYTLYGFSYPTILLYNTIKSSLFNAYTKKQNMKSTENVIKDLNNEINKMPDNPIANEVSISSITNGLKKNVETKEENPISMEFNNNEAINSVESNEKEPTLTASNNNEIKKNPEKQEGNTLSMAINKNSNVETKKVDTSSSVVDDNKVDEERNVLLNEISGQDSVKSTTPTTFKYRAKNPEGHKVDGFLVAYSKQEVFNFLESEGYSVYKIETNKYIELLYGQNQFSKRKLKTKDLIFWLTQLSTYLKSGIPLTDSMRILGLQMGKRDAFKKRLFEAVVYQLILGESFSEALARQGRAFPSLLINMIKAAEATGELEATLDDMANYYNDIETTRKQMISALIYPSAVLIFSIAVVTFILLYVVPSFSSIYESSGAELNALTSFVIGASAFLKKYIIYIILGIVFVIAIIVYLYKSIKSIRYNLQRFAMHLPIFGNILIYNEMTIFTKTFSSLLKNNVFITDSIEILSKITNNEIYKEIMINTINNIAMGEKISESFKDNWAIPDVAYYMIVTGESTGELAEMMSKVSVYYQEEHKNIVNALKSLIEPIMIIFLAVVVGGVVLSVIIPMFGLYNNVNNGQ